MGGRLIMKKFFILLLGYLLASQCLFSLCLAAALSERYPLEKMVVYSRHNLRSPLAIGPDSLLAKLTPHTWFSWTGGSGELSLRGGELETLMGQYFRKWLEDERFIPENYVPREGEVRFYANSAQRTIATTQYFSGGMLPIANVRVERHFALNEADPVFSFHPLNKSFQEQANKELKDMGGVERLGESVAGDVALVERVLDFKDSAFAKENKVQTFSSADDYSVAIDDSLHLSGSIRPAMTAADALMLQYYEAADPASAAFGHELAACDWRGVGRLQSLGLYTIFHLPSFSRAAARPMLETLREELLLEGRKFTFICGHDSGIIAVLSALGVEDYELPQTIEPLTPIGVKFVIEKRRGNDGKAYAAIKLMYQSTEQIRGREMLSLTNPPVTFPLRLKGLPANEDGLYAFDDLLKRLVSV